MSDFNMSDMRRHLSKVESGQYDQHHSVFDLVHAVHYELLSIAELTITNVNQGLSKRLPEGTSCEIFADPDLHPLMRPQKTKGHDWESISRYIELGIMEFGDEGPSVSVGTKVRLSDHRRKKKPGDDSSIVWVKFKINKCIMVRSADGTEYKWRSLTWKPQVDLMNGRNTLGPGAGHGGKMIVKPTFFIRPADMQIIRTDARKRIPATIHESVKKLIDGKWAGAEIGPAPS